MIFERNGEFTFYNKDEEVKRKHFSFRCIDELPLYSKDKRVERKERESPVKKKKKNFMLPEQSEIV